MKLLNKIIRKISRTLRIKQDKTLGHYYVWLKELNQQITYKKRKHAQDEADLHWLVNSLYFKHYFPTADDVVVDFGAGYGEEMLYWLKQLSSGKPTQNGGERVWPGKGKYIGIEIQPSIYEHLCINWGPWSSSAIAWPLYIGQESAIKLCAQESYFSVGLQQKGIITIPGQNWKDFCRYHHLDQIDLLKMNIEGGETAFLRLLDREDFSRIKRFIISCHDFRANHGEGEFFRTKKEVSAILEAHGYHLKTFSYGINWADDWLYASRTAQ